MANDIAWEDHSLSEYIPTQIVTTLAAESRLKPFFEKQGLSFQNIASLIYAAGNLRDSVMSGTDIPEGRIGWLNNRFFPNNEIEIEKTVKVGRLSTGKEYKYAVFQFKKESKEIKALFIKDHEKLTSPELKELSIGENEKELLSCPGLEGVWFSNATVPEDSADPIVFASYGKEPPLGRAHIRLGCGEHVFPFVKMRKFIWDSVLYPAFSEVAGNAIDPKDKAAYKKLENIFLREKDTGPVAELTQGLLEGMIRDEGLDPSDKKWKFLIGSITKIDRILLDEDALGKTTYEVGRQVFRIVRQESQEMGVSDPWKTIKDRSRDAGHAIAKSAEESIDAELKRNQDEGYSQYAHHKIRMALLLVVAANGLDLSIPNISELINKGADIKGIFNELVEPAFKGMFNASELFQDEFENIMSGIFCCLDEIKEGNTQNDPPLVSIWVDNAGEAELVKLFAKILLEMGFRVDLVARSKPALNDETSEDLAKDIIEKTPQYKVFLGRKDNEPGRLRIMGSGSDINGTDWTHLSKESRKSWDDAYMVMLVGTGNAIRTSFDHDFVVDEGHEYIKVGRSRIKKMIVSVEMLKDLKFSEGIGAEYNCVNASVTRFGEVVGMRRRPSCPTVPVRNRVLAPRATYTAAEARLIQKNEAAVPVRVLSHEPELIRELLVAGKKISDPSKVYLVGNVRPEDFPDDILLGSDVPVDIELKNTVKPEDPYFPLARNGWNSVTLQVRTDTMPGVKNRNPPPKEELTLGSLYSEKRDAVLVERLKYREGFHCIIGDGADPLIVAELMKGMDIYDVRSDGIGPRIVSAMLPAGLSYGLRAITPPCSPFSGPRGEYARQRETGLPIRTLFFNQRLLSALRREGIVVTDPFHTYVINSDFNGFSDEAFELFACNLPNKVIYPGDVISAWKGKWRGVDHNEKYDLGIETVTQVDNISDIEDSSAKVSSVESFIAKVRMGMIESVHPLCLKRTYKELDEAGLGIEVGKRLSLEIGKALKEMTAMGYYLPSNQNRNDNPIVSDAQKIHYTKLSHLISAFRHLSNFYVEGVYGTRKNVGGEYYLYKRYCELKDLMDGHVLDMLWWHLFTPSWIDDIEKKEGWERARIIIDNENEESLKNFENMPQPKQSEFLIHMMYVRDEKLLKACRDGLEGDFNAEKIPYARYLASVITEEENDEKDRLADTLIEYLKKIKQSPTVKKDGHGDRVLSILTLLNTEKSGCFIVGMIDDKDLWFSAKKGLLRFHQPKVREALRNHFRVKAGRIAEPVSEAAAPDPAPQNEQLTAQNARDIENARQLLNELIPQKEGTGYYYTVKYNTAKIPQGSLAENLLEIYVEKILPAYLPGKDRIRLIPSGAPSQSLISVECFKDQSRTTVMGKSCIDIDDDTEGKALRIIGMMNMAILASQIPNNTPAEEMNRYDTLMSFIKKQYKDISGQDLPIDVLNNIAEGIRIRLPHATAVPLDKVEEYYRLTIAQFEKAA